MPQNEFSGDVYSILIIEKNAGTGLSKLISDALRAAHAAATPGYRLLYHIAPSLEVLRRHGPNVRVDFVIVAADTREMPCLDWAMNVISELPTSLLLRRTILVNAVGTMPTSGLEQTFCIDTMTADVREPKICNFLAKRIIVYMEDSFGCHTGIPNVYSCARENAMKHPLQAVQEKSDSMDDTME